MTTQSYPSNLPLPLQDGFSLEYKPSVIRTSFSDGSARQRLMPFNNSDFNVSCNVTMTGAQWVIFWNFYKLINYGTDWFTMQLPAETSNQLVNRTVRIQKGAVRQSLLYRNSTDFVYKVSFTLDVRMENGS